MSLPKFLIGEKLVCKYNKDYFLARCRNVKRINSVYSYHIHYINWRSEWDEWVSDCRLLKMTKESFDRFNIDPPKNTVLPSEAELEKKQAKELAQMKFERRKRSDSESSYCIDTPASKSSASKTSIQGSKRKRERESKSCSRSSNSSSTSARSAKVKKVSKNSGRFVTEDIENFLEESEVESCYEDESAAKRFKVSAQSNFSKKTKEGFENRSDVERCYESDGQDSDQSHVEASNYHLPAKMYKPGPASAKKKLDVATKQIDQAEREQKCSIEAGKKSRPCPASKKIGYRTKKATFPNSMQQSETNQSDSDDETSDSGEIIFNRKVFHVNLPPELVYILINDHDMIHYRKSLCRLPASKSVRTILDDFWSENSPGIIFEQTANFLIGCFDSLLDERLLYHLERSQFEAQSQLSIETLPSDLYGGIHLLRLLAQIGKILNRSFSSKMTTDEITKIEKVLVKLIDYLAKNSRILFNPQDVYVELVSDDQRV